MWVTVPAASERLRTRGIRPRRGSGDGRRAEQHPACRDRRKQQRERANAFAASSIEPVGKQPDPDLQVTSAEMVRPSSVGLVIEM
jgi:hypothetical protein